MTRPTTIGEVPAACPRVAILRGLAPAEAMSPVLPRSVPTMVVGGIAPDTMAPRRAARANGLDLGYDPCTPGRPAGDVAAIRPSVSKELP